MEGFDNSQRYLGLTRSQQSDECPFSIYWISARPYFSSTILIIWT